MGRPQRNTALVTLILTKRAGQQSDYLRVFKQYAPLWSALTPSTGEQVRKTNYERIFNEARQRARAWQNAHRERIGVH